MLGEQVAQRGLLRALGYASTAREARHADSAARPRAVREAAAVNSCQDALGWRAQDLAVRSRERARGAFDTRARSSGVSASGIVIASNGASASPASSGS